VNHWGVDGVVGNGVNGVVGNGVDGVVGNGVDGVMSNWVDGVVSKNSVVTNDMIGSMQPVGGISHDGSVGSEGLALGGGPVLSLVRFAH